jgi:hypothetical protein
MFLDCDDIGPTKVSIRIENIQFGHLVFQIKAFAKLGEEKLKTTKKIVGLSAIAWF